MNKSDLTVAVAQSANLTNKDASAALDAVLDTIAAQLKSGNEVRLVGFGTFGTVKRKATTGRNPKTGAELKIPASTRPKFKPGKALKEAVN